MAESASVVAPYPTTDIAGRLAWVAHRILLPAVSVGSAFLGILLLTNPVRGSSPLIALGLIASGSALLAGSALAETRAFPSAAAGPELVGPRPVAPEPRPPTEEGSASIARHDARRRSLIAGRSSEWRVLSAPTFPGDETWLSWLPPEHRRLGPASYLPVVPTPGPLGSRTRVVVDPGRRAEPDVPTPRSADRRHDGWPTESLSAPPSPVARRGGRSAFTEEELDKMFPPENGRSSVFLSAPPDKVGTRASPRADNTPENASRGRGPRADSVPESAPEFEFGASDDAGLDPAADLPEGSDTWDPGPSGAPPEPLTAAASLADTLMLEANNPVPPHLRGPGALPHPLPHATRGNAAAPMVKTVCASCSKVVMNLRMSGPCPRCLRPICNDCLRDALLQHGHGWCIDCGPTLAAVEAS